MSWEGRIREGVTEEVTYEPCLKDELQFIHRRGKGHEQAEETAWTKAWRWGQPAGLKRGPLALPEEGLIERMGYSWGWWVITSFPGGRNSGCQAKEAGNALLCLGNGYCWGSREVGGGSWWWVRCLPSQTEGLAFLLRAVELWKGVEQRRTESESFLLINAGLLIWPSSLGLGNIHNSEGVSETDQMCATHTTHHNAHNTLRRHKHTLCQVHTTPHILHTGLLKPHTSRTHHRLHTLHIAHATPSTQTTLHMPQTAHTNKTQVHGTHTTPHPCNKHIPHTSPTHCITVHTHHTSHTIHTPYTFHTFPYYPTHPTYPLHIYTHPIYVRSQTTHVT